MAVKRKNQKKKKLQELYDKAVKIKCCYCDIKGECTRRSSKEQSERMGITTYCTLTPNRPKSFKKRAKSLK
jgi:hypothetical protein